jgi:glycosyltransferase involved in cell wall biosynthesis
MIALTQRLTKMGYRVDFVTRAGSGPLDSRALAAGATIRQTGELLDDSVPFIERTARRLQKNLRWITEARRQQYDIVDAWLQPTDAVAALTRPVTRIPVVMTARLGARQKMPLGPATELFHATVHRMIDVVVANADVTAREAVAQGVPPERIRVIRGGVAEPPTYTPEERQARRQRLGASDDDLLIGSVGNLRPMKRQDLLIDAFAHLLPRHPDLRLVLVGDGELRPRIEAQIKALGLESRVLLYGRATDLSALYDAFDLFVQSSNSEGLPNVLLEASASRLAIVATAAGGTGELVIDGDTGLLVPVDDLDRLTDGMRMAIEDVELRRRLGESAHRLIERDYGMERFAREYSDLYQEQLAFRRRGAGSP